MEGINICFYGLNRSLLTTHGAIQDLVINPCKSLCNNTTIYASFNRPKNNKIYSKRSQEFGTPMSSGDPSKLLVEASINYIDQDEFDATFDFDEIMSYGDFFNDYEAKTPECSAAGSIVNQLRALNSLRKSYLSIPATRRRKYPTFFVRPDLTIIEPLDIDLILNLCSLGNSCVVPSWHHWYGVNDRFAACSAGKASESYALRLNYLSCFLMASDTVFHPERYLYSILSIRNITILPVIDSRFIRVRSGERFHNEPWGNEEKMPSRAMNASWGMLVKALYAERDKNKSIEQ